MIPVPDALLGPLVCGLLWALAAAALTISVRRLRATFAPARLPLLAAGCALLTALQSLALPAWPDGLSFVPCGALALSLWLGPYAAFCATATALTLHACLWNTCGLLALGAVICHAAFLPCFVLHPFCFLTLAGPRPDVLRTALAACLSGIGATLAGGALLLLEMLAGGTASLPPFAARFVPLCLSAALCEGVLAALAALLPHRTAATGAPSVRTTAAGLLATAVLLCALSGLSPASVRDGLGDAARAASLPPTAAVSEPHRAAARVHAFLTTLRAAPSPAASSPAANAPRTLPADWGAHAGRALGMSACAFLLMLAATAALRPRRPREQDGRS